MAVIDDVDLVFRGGFNEYGFRSVVVMMCCRRRILVEFRSFLVIW